MKRGAVIPHDSIVEGGETMCKLCDEGKPQDHSSSQPGRRDFLKASTAAAAGAAGMSLFAARPAKAHDGGDPPRDSGRPGRRYVIRGGAVMSMDPAVGDFPQADVLVDGKKILAVGPNLRVGGADEIDARGRIVMPGFIDTHHHLFETSLRSFLADGILINDGSNTPSGNTTYFEFILLKFAPVYRAQDVYINELFGSLSQLDAGVTTVHDISQIHHSPQHSDAAIKALFDSGRRAAFGYFESAGAAILGTNPGNKYPDDAGPHQEAVVLLERPARPHDHGRRGLPSELREGLEDRAPARAPDRGAYPLSVQHSPHPGPARPGPGRRQPYAGARIRQPVHPHDRDVRPGLAGRQGQGRAGFARRPDRDEHAPRHAARPQDAKPGHGAVPELRTWSAR
jgi:hypothetical protein